MENGIDALLIEDSLVDAQLVEALISSAKFDQLKLYHNQHFYDALDAIQTQCFDVILLDLCLPDGRGVDLVKQLKERYAIERAELIQAIATSKERYSLAVEGDHDGIWDWNLATNLVFYSARWRSLIGLLNKDANESPNQWRSHIHPQDRDAFEHLLKAHLAYPQRQQFHHKYRLLHADGNYRWVIKDFNLVTERLTGKQASGADARPISEVCHLLIFHDVTQERGYARQLAWQASHDPLTHLFNRQKFIQSIDECIAKARRQQTHHVLCCMDLDHFKTVNDTCGHAAGDQLLRRIADLWRTKIRASDSLARLGGDEFGLLLYDCKLDRAIEIANNLCQSIQTFRFTYDNKTFNLGVSIGLVPITQQTINTEAALQLADSACYRAKDKGRNRVQVHDQDDQEVQQYSSDSQWFARITKALDEDQFVLYEQAILPARTDSTDISLSEILLRLKEGEETILPMAFIPPAERYNLMPKIDRWVIRHFLAYLSSRHARLTDPVDKLYSINLSGCSINDESFIDFVKEQLEQHPTGVKALCFEITETVAISNLPKAASFMLELKQLGCQFALDDFGSGMSSFTYLKHLPVDFLKIDGNFVKEAAEDHITCAMLEAINQVGHVMELKTIAEYVENQPILDKVRELGIDYVQGFAIKKPTRLN